MLKKILRRATRKKSYKPPSTGYGLTLVLLLFFVLLPISFYLLTNVDQVESAWYSTGGTWTYRKSITIDADQVAGSGDHTNFPVMISLTSDSDLSTNAQADGDDILFTSADGTTKLDHEIESYSSGTLVAWVEIPTLDFDDDTVIYMYYGNGSATNQQNPTGVWNSNFAAVHHLEETTTGANDYLDSTSNNIDSTTVTIDGSGDANATGQIDGANTFDGNDRIGFGDVLGTTSSFTISAWVNPSSLAAAESPVFNKTGASAARDWSLMVLSSGAIQVRLSSDGSTTITRNSTATIGTGAWYYITGVYDASAQTLSTYIDGSLTNGTLSGTVPASITASTNPVFIARRDSNATHFTGTIDEVRFLTTALSADWITTEFNNQDSPGTFYTVGTAETEPTPTPTPTNTPTNTPTPTPTPTPAQGNQPVAYWKLDEGVNETCGSNNDACDAINDSDGAMVGGTWQTEDMCIAGKCLWFDGTDDDIAMGDNANLDMSSSFSISTWVKFNDLTSAASFTLLEKGVAAGTANYYLWYNNTAASPNDTLVCGFHNGTSYQDHDLAWSPNLSQWYQVTCVFDDTGNTVKIYIDGKELLSEAQTTSPSADNGLLYLASDRNDGAHFEGFLDEVKLYDYARTASQVKADVNAHAPPGSTATFGKFDTSYLNQLLTGFWKFNDNVSGNGQSLVDASGNGKTATTNYGANTTGMDCTVAGEFGRGCDLDGTDDYISVASPNLPTTDFTYSAWINVDGTTDETIFMASDGSGGDELNISVVSGAIDVTLNASAVISGAGTISADTWHLVTITRRGGLVRVYIDADLEGSGLNSDTLSFSSCALLIGTDNDTSGCTDSLSGYLDGTIDDPRVYGQALSWKEVTNLYEWGPLPIGYWTLDENTGTTTTFDRSGNSTNGTLTSITDASWSPGKYGSGLALDGSADFVDIGTGPNFVKTIEFWVKPTTDTEYFINLTSNTDYISASAGTISATGLSSPTIYVNGVDTTTLTTGVWQHVAITTATAENASNLDIGRTQDTNYLEGVIDDVRLYNYVRNPGQIIEDMNGGHPMGGSPVGSPVAHYKFDEGADNTCSGGSNDVCNSGNGGSSFFDATSTATRTKSGKINEAMVFNGSSGGVTTTAALDQAFTAAQGTMTVWVKPTGTSPTQTHPYNLQNIVGDLGQFAQITRGTIGGEDRIWIYNEDGTYDSVGVTYTNDEWVHIAWVHDNGTLYAYKNGQLFGSTPSGNTTNLTGEIYIGHNTNANEQWFEGQIDEVKIYNGALTAEQVKIDYNAGAAINFGTGAASEASTLSDGAGDPPVAFYPLNENTGTSTTADKSGNGFTGTLTSITASSWKPGKKGSALSLDGSADYVDVGTGPSTVRSVSFWVKPTTTTEYFINLTSTTDYISASAGTISATGLSSPTIYVNGIPSTTLTAGVWQHIAVTTATAENASNLDIGRTTDSNYLEGVIDEVKLWDYALTHSQVMYDYNRGGPVGWWKLDECTGTTAYDSSGQGKNATIDPDTLGNTATGTCDSGTTTEMWDDGTNGKYNGSLGFDGTDDIVTADFPNMITSYPFALSAWIKTTASGSTRTIAWLGDKDDTTIYYAIDINTSGFICIKARDGGVSTANSCDDLTVNDGEWHHITGVFASATDRRIYIDGKLSFSNTVSMNFNTAVDQISIGFNGGTSPSLYFSGQIDEVRVYNYIPSVSQIYQIMNNSAGARFGPSSGSP